MIPQVARVVTTQSDEIKKVLDGDTIDVIIDLGFDLAKTERVRIAGVDTPEKELEIWRRRLLVLTRLNGLKTASKVLLTVTMTLLLGLNLLVGSVNMVVFLGELISGIQTCRLTNK
ncbi:MAG: hypothetical protein CM15mV22_0420 [Eurybiavirus sp.]|nr:MAG: hypothetical protein CM15mV22_0420 [Eurybiavirus sp.]